MTLRVALSVLLGLTLTAGCGANPAPIAKRAYAADVETSPAPNAPAPNAPAVEDIVRSYHELHLLTAEPVAVDLEVFLLCSSQAIESRAEQSRKRAGPHALTAIRVFMNDSAADAFRRSAKTYPVGAVIVKEKQKSFDDPAESSGETAPPPLAVAGMIKRASGYDPPHGDWEYFYFEDAAKLQQGKLAACIECHRNAAKTDHVFGDWFERE